MNYTATKRSKLPNPSITTVKGSVEFRLVRKVLVCRERKDFAIELGNKGADKATVAAADETKDATEG